MWIITNRGFLSAVAKDRAGKPSGAGPNAILSVRGRRRGDLEAMFPGQKIVETPDGDYRYRVFVSRRKLADFLANEALGMSATNFKSSIPKKDGALYSACMKLWHVFGELQPGGPYGDRWLRSLPEYRVPVDWDDAPDPDEVIETSTCDTCGVSFDPSEFDEETGLCWDCAEEAESLSAPVSTP